MGCGEGGGAAVPCLGAGGICLQNSMCHAARKLCQCIEIPLNSPLSESLLLFSRRAGLVLVNQPCQLLISGFLKTQAVFMTTEDAEGEILILLKFIKVKNAIM